MTEEDLQAESSPSQKVDFKEAFKKVRPEQIQDLKLFCDPLYDQQPEYIRFADVSYAGEDDKKQHRIAFLNMKCSQILAAKGSIFWPSKLVVPRHFQMVRPEVLRDVIKVDKGKSIEVKKEMLFEGCLESTFILDVFLNPIKDQSLEGSVFSFDELLDRANPLHPCEDVNLTAGGENCHNEAVTVQRWATEDAKDESPLRNLLIFYLNTEDMIRGDEIDENDGHFQFAEEASQKMVKHFNCLPRGFFFIVIKRPDQALAYAGIPNFKKVRSKLELWFECINKFDPNSHHMVISSSDRFMLPIDQWSVTITKDCIPQIKPRTN